MIVGVDEIVAVIFVAGEMDLLHAIDRNRLQIVQRIKLVIHAADIDVVDIEQQQTIGALRRSRAGTPIQ